MNRVPLRRTFVLFMLLAVGGCIVKPTMSLSTAIREDNVQEVRSNLFWETMCTVAGPLDKTGRTPLHAAAQHGQEAVAKYLIERGADVNSLGHWSCGTTPLHLAAAGGHLEMTRLLLAAGADPGIKNKDKKLPKTLAAEAGHPKVARILDRDGGR